MLGLVPQLLDGALDQGELSLPTKVVPERQSCPSPVLQENPEAGRPQEGRYFGKSPETSAGAGLGELPGTGKPSGKPQPPAEHPCWLPTLSGAVQQVPYGLSFPCQIMLCSESSLAP